MKTVIRNFEFVIEIPVLQLSWLERYTDNVEVGSSTLPGTTPKLLCNFGNYELRIKNYELKITNLKNRNS